MESKPKASGIDAYIALFPPPTQVILKKFRATVHQAAPAAEEGIKYGIPTFLFHGNLVHFAAFNNHIGFYPTPSALVAFKKELSKFKGAKGSVQFPIDEPLPWGVITRIVKFRVKQSLANVAAKSEKR